MLTRHRAAVLTAAVAACSLTLGALAPAVVAAPGGRAAPAGRGGQERPASHGAPGFSRSSGTQLVKDLRAAWQISRGEGVTIALIGTGVDSSAAGLGGKVTQGPAFGNVKDDSAIPNTVLASAMAGSGPSASNPAGTVGLAPAARILALRIDERTRLTSVWQQNVGRAIRYAAGHGAKVIYVDDLNPTGDANLDGAVQYALSKGAVVICAEFRPRGQPVNAATFPNSLPGVLGVATVVVPGMSQPPPSHDAVPANDSILLSAPGNVLIVSGPAGMGYEVFNAYAAVAWLAATVAIIKSVYPTLPPALVARALALSARDHPRGGYNTKVGFGMIDPIGALHEVAKLRGLRTVAGSGPGVAAPAARFLSGPAPGPINAVRHSPVKLAGFGGAMVAGLVLLLLAVVIWRRRRRVAVAQVPGASSTAPPPMTAPERAPWAVPPAPPAASPTPPWAQPPAPPAPPPGAPPRASPEPPWAPPSAPPEPPWAQPAAPPAPPPAAPPTPPWAPPDTQ